MRYFIFLSTVIFCLVFSSLNAQEISYGFKAGLNFSTFQAESEMDQIGGSPEEYSFNPGFLVGIIFKNQFTDLFGAKAEILYSQKGTKYRYKGGSYQPLLTTTGETIQSTGNKDLSLNITNAYIDIPVSFYGRAFSWLELHAGVSAGFLVSSSGSGELRYTSASSDRGTPIEDYIVSLDHKYFSDKGGIGELGDDPIQRTIDGKFVEIPKSLGAYYDYAQDEDVNLFNRLDFGVHAGFSLYLNQGLFLGLRGNLGLSDLTDNEVDKSIISQGTSGFSFRDDKDTNLSLQAFIGFSF